MSFQSVEGKNKQEPSKTAYNVKPLPVSTNMNNNRNDNNSYRDS